MERARSSNPISKQTALLVQSKKAFSKVDDIKTVKKSMNKMNTFTKRLKLLKKQMKILDMKNSVKEKE